jgi:MarR family transcriptional regulator, lower aerobic nicotinate degradation pathway regulator
MPSPVAAGMGSTSTSKRVRLPLILEHRAGSMPFSIETHIFYWFGQIFGYRNQALNRELRSAGLDYQRWRVLAALNEHPGCSMQRLAEITAVDRTTLTHTLGLMVKDGLVLRQQRENDRRSVVLSLSRTGRATLKRILPAVLRQNARAVADFTPKETKQLLNQLRRMVDNLKD